MKANKLISRINQMRSYDDKLSIIILYINSISLLKASEENTLLGVSLNHSLSISFDWCRYELNLDQILLYGQLDQLIAILSINDSTPDPHSFFFISISSISFDYGSYISSQLGLRTTDITNLYFIDKLALFNQMIRQLVRYCVGVVLSVGSVVMIFAITSKLLFLFFFLIVQAVILLLSITKMQLHKDMRITLVYFNTNHY